MADVATDIYRPQTQQNPLQTIVQVGQAANALGDVALGGAMQQALDPATGNVDQNRLLSTLRQSPVGAAKAVSTMDALQKLRQAGFAADQAGLETFQKRMALTHHLFSGIASKPNPTMDDIYEIGARALDPKLDAAKYGITLPVIMNAIGAFRGLTSPQIRKKALEIQTQAASTAEILQQHSPGMQAIDRGGNIEFVPTGTRSEPAIGTVVPKNLTPQTRVATPQGERYVGEQPAPPPAAVMPGQQPGAVQPGPDEPIQPRRVPTQRIAPPPEVVPRGPAASLPPGYGEAATGIAQQSASSANELTRANDTSPGRMAILQNMKSVIDDFTPGKGADWSLMARNFATRSLPMPQSWKDEGGVLDLKSIASQEKFNKLAVELAQRQFATIGGTGTDAKFNSAYETSPQETLSKMGNIGIIRMLQGNEDAIRAKNRAWQDWLKEGNGPDTYGQFSVDFNDRFDPRVFQFKYISPKERETLVRAMPPDERTQFLDNVLHAHAKRWVTYGIRAGSGPVKRD